MNAAPTRAVFLDRDGTINVDVGWCGNPDLLELFEGAAEAVARINALGLLAIVVTNQSAVARGMFPEETVHVVNSALAGLVQGVSGARIDAFYHCPHHPTEGTDPALTRQCDCRKPMPGMLLRAASDHGIELGASFMVGDSDRDHLAAKAANPGIVTFGVPGSENTGAAEHQVTNLLAAVERIEEILNGASPGSLS